ncbi:MAG: hypothetical protein J5766_03535 [Clostridia bacterium]|nr:hypothetical protein [Clostridia bacterium]
MKKTLIVFAVGILVGAIIATGSLCVYAAVKNSNAKVERSSSSQVSKMPGADGNGFGQPPEMQSEENNDNGNSQMPQLPNGRNGNFGQNSTGDRNGSSFPGMPGGQDGQSGDNSQMPELPENGAQEN